MKKGSSRCAAALLLGTFISCLPTASGQSQPEIPKDNISIHPVRRGDMPILLMPRGEVTSLTPPTVVVKVPSGATPAPQIGQQASVQVKPPSVMVGAISDIDRATQLDWWQVTIALKDSLPEGIEIGAKAASLIKVGEIKDTVFFERPANARENSEMPLFVIEPQGDFARRAQVRFGRQSGGLIQVLAGLQPGDMVIVTDTTPWNSFDRVHLK